MANGTTTVEFVPEGFDEIEKRFANSKESVRIVQRSVLQRIGKVMVPALKDETPKGSSRKLRNKTYSILMGDNTTDMRVEVRQVARSDRGFPYGIAVRTGTKPHFPPYRALIPWVKAVLDVPEAQAGGVAFVIARKISQVGTEANPYHVRAYESKVGEIQPIVEDEMNRLVNMLTEGV
jgi:hypothetical protein